MNAKPIKPLHTLRLYGLSFLAFFCFAASSFAQADAPVQILWDKTVGSRENEYPAFVLELQDGGFLLGGTRSNDGDFDYWIVRLEEDGTERWSRAYGSSEDDRLSSAIRTKDGGFLLAGVAELPADDPGDRTKSGAAGVYAWLLRVDSAGTLIWDQIYEGADEQAPPVIAAAAGGDDDEQFVLAYGSGILYRFLRLDGQGALLAEPLVYGGGGTDRFSALAPAPDGGWLLCGSSVSDAGGDKSEDARGAFDYWVVRVDSAGAVLWDKTLGGTGRDLLRAAIALSDGGFLLAGHSESDAGADKTDPAYGQWDVWVVRLDADGRKIWDRAYGEQRSENIRGSTLAESADGGFFLAVESGSRPGKFKSEPGRGGDDYWLLRGDAEGRLLWDKTFGGGKSDAPSALRVLQSGQLLLAGYSESDAGDEKSEDANREDQFDAWALRLEVGQFFAGRDQTICPPGGPGALSAIPSETSDATYRWEPANLVENPDSLQTPTLELTETTTFTLTATLPNDSTLADEVTISIAEEKPRFRQLLKRDVYGAENGVIRVSGTGGAPPYEYRLNDGAYATERFFRNLPSGLYLAEIRDANGCEDAAEVRLR